MELSTPVLHRAAQLFMISQNSKCLNQTMVAKQERSGSINVNWLCPANLFHVDGCWIPMLRRAEWGDGDVARRPGFRPQSRSLVSPSPNSCGSRCLCWSLAKHHGAPQDAQLLPCCHICQRCTACWRRSLLPWPRRAILTSSFGHRMVPASVLVLIGLRAGAVVACTELGALSCFRVCGCCNSGVRRELVKPTLAAFMLPSCDAS